MGFSFKLNLVGQKFNKLFVLRELDKEERKSNKRILFLCQCDCGKERIVSGTSLKNGAIKSCGCTRKAKKRLASSMIGETFNGNVVMRESDLSDPRNVNGKRNWICICECGNEFITTTELITSNRITGCGCYKEKKLDKLKEKLVGKTFGSLQVIGFSGKIKNKLYFKCKCKCGNEGDFYSWSLLNNEIVSCGCKSKNFFKGKSGKLSFRYNHSLSDEDRLSNRNRHLNPLYIAWRNSVLKKYLYICQKCKKSSKYVSLHVHHIKGYKEFLDLRFNIDNGIVLCKSCHIKFHLKFGKTGDLKNELENFININEV